VAERPTPLRTEVVGPREGSVDVAGWTDRQLTGYVVDTVLHVKHDLGQLRAGLGLDLEDKEHRLRVLEGRARVQASEAVTPVEGRARMREKETSWHDYDAELERARLMLRDRVKDPGDRGMTSDRARAIAMGVVHAVEDERELQRWRGVRGWLGSRAGKLVDRGLTVAAAGAIGWLIHYLSR